MTIIIIIINPQCNPDLNRDDHNHDNAHQYNRDDHPNPPPPPLSAPLCSPASKRVFGEQPGKGYFLKLSKDFVIFLSFVHCFASRGFLKEKKPCQR